MVFSSVLVRINGVEVVDGISTFFAFKQELEQFTSLLQAEQPVGRKALLRKLVEEAE